DTTLVSYGLDFTPQTRMEKVHAEARIAVPQAHLDFLAAGVLSHETETLFFAHAGIRPGVPLARQTEHDLLWIRQEFHAEIMPHPKLIVHGHTPVRQATHYGNRINLDTGAGYGDPLTVAVFEGADCWRLTAAGREPGAIGQRPTLLQGFRGPTEAKVPCAAPGGRMARPLEAYGTSML
ncbi:MAG: hypothetical protein AAGC81_15365, partial [Pseudomonadota bacterium]